MIVRNEKSAQRGSFGPDIPADIPADIPPKTSVRPSKSWKKQAYRNGHPTRTSMQKLRSEKLRADFPFPRFRARSTTTRDRNLQFRGAVSTGGSPLDFLLFSSIYVQFSKTSPLQSGESSEKSSGENRVKSCHVCGCHGFFGPDRSMSAW